MDFSMKLFAVLSILLFVSMAADMGNPVVVDAQSGVQCDQRQCNEDCMSKHGLFGCCPCCLQEGPCTCTHIPACPLVTQAKIPDPKHMMIKLPVA